jgi:hypothetical protein
MGINSNESNFYPGKCIIFNDDLIHHEDVLLLLGNDLIHH